MDSKRIRNRDFFTKPAEDLAKDLLGKILCRRMGKDFVMKSRIKVTEAYRNDEDCTDANRDKAPNSQLLSGGHLHYFYKTCDGRRRIDIVAGSEGVAESVLIRETDLYDGPQKVVWALDIKMYMDGIDLLSKDSEVWIEDDGTVAILDEPKPRINISEKSTSKDSPLRFSAKSFIFPN